MKKSLLVTLAFIGCTSSGVKTTDQEHREVKLVASLPRNPQSSRQFIDGIDKIGVDIRDRGIFNAQSCEAYLGEVNEYVLRSPHEQFIPTSEAERTEFFEKSDEMIQKIFLIRLGLIEALRDFEKSGQVGSSCVGQIRTALRIGRGAEEQLMLWQEQNGLKRKYVGKTFASPFPEMLVNPKFKEVTFESGDVLMLKSPSFVSATIARIGDEDGQFSHIAMIHVDETTGKKYLLESVIEVGTKITELDKVLKKTKARAVLFRHPDRDLAKRASKWMFDAAVEYKRAHKTNIPYDFGMVPDTDESLFCAELARTAYQHASDGQVAIPNYMTSFEKIWNNPLLHEFGVTSKITFSPNDMDVESRFDLVAEFRDLKQVRQVRIQDAMMQSVLSWMADREYRIRHDLDVKLLARLAIRLRWFGLLDEKLPRHMKRKTLRVIGTLNRITKYLEKQLTKYEEEYFKANQVSPSYSKLLAHAETLRVNDCQAYNKYQEVMDLRMKQDPKAKRTRVEMPDFHLIFNAFERPTKCN